MFAIGAATFWARSSLLGYYDFLPLYAMAYMSPVAAKKDVKIFMSEYDAPDDFKCIWQMEKKDGLGRKKGKKQNTKVEKLFVYQN